MPKIPWRSEQLPTPVCLPGEFHGQMSLTGDNPWGCKKLDMTEGLSLQFRIEILSRRFTDTQKMGLRVVIFQ